MKITEIKVFPVAEEKLKAFVSIVIEDCFMVNDIKVIRGRDGLFISMPSRRKKNGKFKDVAHPLNNETRQTLEGLILEEYDRVLGEEGASQEATASEPAAAEEQPIAAAPSAVPMTGPNEPRPAGRWDTPDSDTGNDLEDVTQAHLRDSFWTT